MRVKPTNIFTDIGSAILYSAWRMSRQDRRSVVSLLGAAELDRRSPLGAELEAMLRARVRECRDFFALRGVQPKGLTALQMAGRSLATDRGQIARIDAMSPGSGRPLLRAISQMIDATAADSELLAA